VRLVDQIIKIKIDFSSRERIHNWSGAKLALICREREKHTGYFALKDELISQIEPFFLINFMTRIQATDYDIK
jgi:hypothetical protein